MEIPLLLAQAAGAAGIASWVIWAIIVAGIVAIGLVVARQTGVNIPPFVVNIFWIVLVVVVAVVAIKFLLGVV